MFAYLHQHPQVYLPLRKEVHYFGSDLTRVPGNFWFVEDLAEYLALYSRAPPGTVSGDASVLYLFSERAAKEIHDFDPAARIIVQLRNPVDMLYSYHGQLRLAMQEDIEDFEAAYDASDARRRLERLPRYCIMPQQLRYPDIARYPQQLQRYFDHFGRDQVHVMLYDDFRRDPAGEFTRILSFLDVDASFRPSFDSINSHRQVRCSRLQGETQLPSWPTRMLLSLCSDSLRYRILTRLAEMNSRPANREPLPPAFRARLAREFAADVEQLGAMLGRDLAHWTAGVAAA